MSENPNELAAKAAQGEENWNPTLGGACVCIWACIIGLLVFGSLFVWGAVVAVRWIAAWWRG